MKVRSAGTSRNVYPFVCDANKQGGEDDITSGSVWENNGNTYLRFKKRIKSGPADHPFQGKIHFIYATGQLNGFYQADQLKYHGRNSQRGIAILEAPYQSGEAADPFTIGLAVVLVLLSVVFLIQIIQNLERQYNCLKRVPK